MAAMIKAALSSGNGDERPNPGNGNLYDQADEAGQKPATPSTDEMLAVLMKKLPDMLKKLLDTVGNLTAGDSKDAGAAMTRHAILAFFDPALEGDDLVLTLNYTKIQNFLLCDTYADMIDYLCGDGTFTALLNKIYAIGDSTVAQIAGKINEAGLDYTKAYQELNDLIREASAGKCNTLEELLAMMGIDLGVDEETGKPLTVIDLLNRLIDSKMTVFELVCGMMSGPEAEMTVADLKEMIAGMFNGNLIDTIAAMIPQGGTDGAEPDLSKNRDMVLKAIDFAVTALNRDLKIDVVIGKNAALKSVEINANINIANYNPKEKGSFVISLSLLTGEAGKLNIKTLADEINAKTDRIKLNKKSLSKYLNDGNYVLEFDENDNLVSVTPTNNITPRQYVSDGTGFASGRDAGGSYVLCVCGVKTYMFDAEPMVMVGESCGSNDLVGFVVNTITNYAIYKHYARNVLVPYEGTEYDEEYASYLQSSEETDNLYFSYNTKTGKVTFTSADTLHTWKEDKAAFKPAEGCTGVGEIHYTCVKCGDTYIKFYINGHVHTKAEAAFLTEEKDCTKGVRITTTCTDCGKVLSVKDYDNHERYVLATIDCKELGGKCGGYILVKGCACGMISSYLDRDNLECENDKYTDGRTVELTVNGVTKDVYTSACGVDEPYCGFFWGFYTEPVTVGCLHGSRVTYVFGIRDQNDKYTVKKVVTGGTDSLCHEYSKMTSDTKTYTLPKSGITVTLPIRRCESCGYYCTYIDDKDSDGDLKHCGTIYFFGTKESMYEVIGGTVGNGKYYFEIAESHFSDGSFALKMEEYYETGEFHVDEHKYSVKDHTTRYEREVFYGKDGNNGDRCHAVSRWYEDGKLTSSNDISAEDGACSRFYKIIKESTCTGWELYTNDMCIHCGYSDGEIERGRHPYGHQFVESANGYVCEVCGLKSNTGVNGNVYMEDLNRGDAATGYQNGFKFGYFSREYQIWEDYTPTVVLVPAGDADGEDLVLDLNMNADSTAAQDYIEFTWGDLTKAVSQDYAGVSGTYLLKFVFVSESFEDANDYAITLDIVITIQNGQIVR